MLHAFRAGLLLVTAITAAALLDSRSGAGVHAAGAPQSDVAAQAPDTATVRIHISRMTCGSCPTTARLALKRLPGVYSATVTLADSLGVVRYDPQRVTASRIAAHLTQLTGFGATILPDSSQGSLP